MPNTPPNPPLVPQWLASLGVPPNGSLPHPSLSPEACVDPDDLPCPALSELPAREQEAALLPRLRIALRTQPRVLRNDPACFVEHWLDCEWRMDWTTHSGEVRPLGASADLANELVMGLRRVLMSSQFLRPWLAAQLGSGVTEEARVALGERLWQRIRRSPELHAARRHLLQIRRQLDQPVELALRLFGDADPTTEDLPFVREHAGSLTNRLTENPRLLPLLGLVPRDAREVWRGDYAQLQAYLFTRQLSPAGWRLLHRHGRRLWQGAIGTRRFIESPLTVVIAIANALGRSGMVGLPAPEIIRCFVDADGLVVEGTELARLVPARVLAKALRRLRSIGSRGRRRAFVENELPPVIDWWHGSNQQETAVPARAGWPWYRRQAQLFQEEQRVRREADGRVWENSLPAMTINGISIIPLTSAIDLWREATAMRNCLDDESYVRRCARGSYALISLRSPGRKRPLATFSAVATREGAVVDRHVRPGAPIVRWERGEMFAATNRPPAEHLVSLADRYLEEVTLQLQANRETPLAHPRRRSGRSPDLRLRMLGQRHGLLYVELTARRKSVVLRLSDTLDSLQSILRWLEGIAVGARNCSAFTDGEGFERELRFSGAEVGIFSVYCGDEERFATRIAATELVATFYAGFRGMLASRMGQSLEWEPGCLLDRLESCLIWRPTRRALVHRLAQWPRQSLIALLTCLADLGPGEWDDATVTSVCNAVARGPSALSAVSDSLEPLLPANFDRCPLALRMDELAGSLRREPSSATGTRLHSQRSLLVEKWLAGNGVDLAPWIRVVRRACDKEMYAALAELARRDRFGVPLAQCR